MNHLLITSPAFESGHWIPLENSARGIDVSPELHIDGICENGVSMAITLDDASHPLFPNYNHWVIWNLPIQRIIPAAIAKGERVSELSDAAQGVAYGKHCYKGPKPPLRSIHTYTFTVYIFDCRLDLSPKCRRKELIESMKGHVLQTATLSGKFQSYRN